MITDRDAEAFMIYLHKVRNKEGKRVNIFTEDQIFVLLAKFIDQEGGELSRARMYEDFEVPLQSGWEYSKERLARFNENN